MFFDLIEYPIESKKLKWEAKYVVRDLYGRPHLLLRLHLTGTLFKTNALEPWVSVGDTRSCFVELADDGSYANAYFDSPLQEGERIEFGFENKVYLRFPKPYDSEMLVTLDVKRLPKGIQLVEKFYDPY